MILLDAVIWLVEHPWHTTAIVTLWMAAACFAAYAIGEGVR